MKILLTSYSRTGTTEAVAERAAELLRASGHDIEHARLVPLLPLPYAAWLLLSFFPGSRVPLRRPLPDPSGYDALLLALPKWTFSCPPVNQFLAERGAALPHTTLLVTCGGWGQERYLSSLRSRLERLGVVVSGGLAVRKKSAGEASTHRVLADFLARALVDRAPP